MAKSADARDNGPDEAYRPGFRDVTIVLDEGTQETILEIEVRGKRGVGYCMQEHQRSRQAFRAV